MTIFFARNADNALQYRTAIRLTRRTARAIAPSQDANRSFASIVVQRLRRNEPQGAHHECASIQYPVSIIQYPVIAEIGYWVLAVGYWIFAH